MCHIELETCELWHEHKRKARKQHQCSCCKRTIEPGESYLVHFSMLDSVMNWAKCCSDCERDRAEFAKAHDHLLCTPDFFEDLLLECIGESEEEDRARWRPILQRIQSSRAG